MNIRKVLAGSLAAITAGATLVFGAAALTDFSDYVSTDDGALKSPVIVIGNPSPYGAGFAKDVVGAADLAANIAGFATQDVTVTGGTATSVSGGVVTTSQNTKLYLADNLGESGLKTTLTKSDLPSLLASGTFHDDNDIAYGYNQYVNINLGTVTYGKSGGDFSDPVLYLDIGSSPSAPFFNMTVILNKVIDIGSSVTQGNTIDLFGNTYTITTGSQYTTTSRKLVLFGAANTITMEAGEEKEITVGDTTYTVKLIGVSSATQVIVSVDGVSKSITTTSPSSTISGLNVLLEDVYYLPKESDVSSAKLSFGSQKLTLEHGQAVKVGTEETSIDGTMVNLEGNLSKISIGISGKDSSNDWIKQSSDDADNTEDDVFVDPVFGKLKVNFHGATGGDTEVITIDNSGTTGASLKFTSYLGDERALTWAYTPSTWNPVLNTSASKQYHVVEGEDVNKGEYFLYAPTQGSDFGHFFQFKTASSIGSSGAYVELYDLMSQETFKLYLTETGNAAGTAYIDGNPVYIEVQSTLQTANFTWGDGATYNSTGDKITLFPLIKTQQGGWVTLTHPNVTLTNGTTYELPTNGSFEYEASQDNNTQLTRTESGGRLVYDIWDDYIRVVGHWGTTGSTTEYNVSTPAVLFIEEEGKDDNTPANNIKDGWIVNIYDGSSTGADVNIGNSASVGPLSTATTLAKETLESDTSVTMIGDRYGTFVSWDTDSQGLVTVTYPDEQAVAYVGFGSDPSFASSTTTGQTVKSAIKITSPVAKLDSEVSTTEPGADLVIVGGPCANKLAAVVLNMSSASGTCYDDWVAAGYDSNSVGGGPNGIIKEVTDAFTDGSKALVVAGSTADDTRSLAAKVMAGTYAYPA